MVDVLCFFLPIKHAVPILFSIPCQELTQNQHTVIHPTTDPAAVTECLTGASQLKSFKQLLWTMNGAKAAARYVPTSEILSIKRKWLGSATLCVEMPAGNTNPCAVGGLDKICGAGGCQVTAVTTKFDQAGDTNKIKKSCKLAATVPLTGAQLFRLFWFC